MACSTQIRECMASNTVLKENWHLICKKTVKLHQRMLQSPHRLNNSSSNKSNWMNTTLINRNPMTMDPSSERVHACTISNMMFMNELCSTAFTMHHKHTSILNNYGIDKTFSFPQIMNKYI